MRCEKCAERRKKAREALLRAATGVKSLVSKKTPKVKRKRTATKTGTAGKTTLKSKKTEQETTNV